jgi:CheY-like chemotaxis protein
LIFREQMQGHTGHPTGRLTGPAAGAMASPRAARVLLVEDDEDTRQLLALALGGERYTVDEAGTAPRALELLRHNTYDLVLTDYDLPGMTGSALLKEAARQGVLRTAATIVVTAHPSPTDVDPAGLIRKPLDLPDFLAQVRHILAAVTRDASEGASAARADQVAAASGQVELILYVTADSPASQRARRHLETTLARFEPGAVRLEVCDVARDPARGEADRVVFTPTLVARSGGVATWVLGDLSDRAMLLDLLQVCGLEPRT